MLGDHLLVFFINHGLVKFVPATKSSARLFHSALVEAPEASSRSWERKRTDRWLGSMQDLRERIHWCCWTCYPWLLCIHWIPLIVCTNQQLSNPGMHMLAAALRLEYACSSWKKTANILGRRVAVVPSNIFKRYIRTTGRPGWTVWSMVQRLSQTEQCSHKIFPHLQHNFSIIKKKFLEGSSGVSRVRSFFCLCSLVMNTHELPFKKTWICTICEWSCDWVLPSGNLT